MKLDRHAVFAVLVVVLLSAFFSWYVLTDRNNSPIVHPFPAAMQQYSSEEGVTFQYPDAYRLSSTHHSVGGFSWDSLELVDKSISVPANSDGPESISMSVFDDAEGLSLEQFIKNEPRTNYQFSKEGTLTKGTIGGEPSLSYQYSGLYENDAVAVLHNKKIFLFSVSWSQTVEPIRKDFSKILSTVSFQN